MAVHFHVSLSPALGDFDLIGWAHHHFFGWRKTAAETNHRQKKLKYRTEQINCFDDY